eukprot:scpid39697/ scgid26703/ 
MLLRSMLRTVTVTAVFRLCAGHNETKKDDQDDSDDGLLLPVLGALLGVSAIVNAIFLLILCIKWRRAKRKPSLASQEGNALGTADGYSRVCLSQLQGMENSEEQSMKPQQQQQSSRNSGETSTDLDEFISQSAEMPADSVLQPEQSAVEFKFDVAEYSAPPHVSPTPARKGSCYSPPRYDTPRSARALADLKKHASQPRMSPGKKPALKPRPRMSFSISTPNLNSELSPVISSSSSRLPKASEGNSPFKDERRFAFAHKVQDGKGTPRSRAFYKSPEPPHSPPSMPPPDINSLNQSRGRSPRKAHGTTKAKVAAKNFSGRGAAMSTDQEDYVDMDSNPRIYIRSDSLASYVSMHSHSQQNFMEPSSMANHAQASFRCLPDPLADKQHTESQHSSDGSDDNSYAVPRPATKAPRQKHNG